MASYLKAYNDMKKKIKEGKTDWSNLESSEEDEYDKDLAEIFSDEEEPEGGAEATKAEAQSRN